MTPNWTAPSWANRTALAAVFTIRTVASLMTARTFKTVANRGENHPTWRCRARFYQKAPRWIVPVAALVSLFRTAPVLAEEPVLSKEAAPDVQAGVAHFNDYILPLLQQRCYDCHSHEFDEASGGLVLDSKAGWSVGGDSGPPIVPGKPDKSLLLKVIRYQVSGLEMPPDGKLSDEEIGWVEDWIADGAVDPRADGKAAEKRTIDLDTGRSWWAFQPLPEPSDVDGRGARLGRGNLVDPFINRKLADAGLQPAAPADEEVLLRRLSYDLTGLPPSTEALGLQSLPSGDSASGGARVSSTDDLARAVDHLLDTRQFAEKWGRHWLDLARYADSNGSSFNPPFRKAWKYRNWVIEAIDQGMPIDEFIRKQIAGDLLPYDDQQERDANLIATGYLMLGSKVLGDFDKQQLTLDVADEQIDTIGKSLLGLTVACARCHDHKFDPIPQVDYYAIAGILTSTVTLEDRLGGRLADESDWSRRGLGPGGDEELQAFLDENRHDWTAAVGKRFRARREVEKLEAKLADAPGSEEEPLREKLAEQREKLADAERTLSDFARQLPDYAMAAADAEQTGDEALRIRGVAGSPGQIVPRGFLQVATDGEARPEIPEDRSGRLELARWITSSDNPLTARVFVNRVWKHLFREGLVRSVDNFGTMGEQPSHPELLDELTARFVANGWQLKPLVRELVLSDAYRRSTGPVPDSDPENRLLATQNRRRLDPEEIRDTLLELQGALDLSPGEGMIDHLPISDVSNLGEALKISDHRRTIYQPVIRTLEPTVLQVFDAPVNTMTTGARSKTVVAQQALFFLNSQDVVATAESVAGELLQGRESLTTATASTVSGLVDQAFTQIVGRQPKEQEREVLLRYTTRQADDLYGLTRHDALKLCQTILSSTQFQFLD